MGILSVLLSQVWVRATPPYCHMSATIFSRLSCAATATTTTTTTILSGGGPRSLCCLLSTTGCTWGRSLKHSICPGHAGNHTTLTLACPCRSLRTCKCAYMIPMHRAGFIFLYFDILGNNIWGTDKGKK